MGTVTADYTGEVVLVTGAAGGMGTAVSGAFARSGATVVMVDIDGTAEDSLSTALDPFDTEWLFVRADVSDPGDVEAMVETTLGRYGRLDHAINAAAIENETVPLHECGIGDFDRIHAVNVRGVFLSMRSEIAAMLSNDRVEGRRGSIVNIASTNSFLPQGNQPAYTAAKHAVLGLTRSAALDYASLGIRVNAICPGSIDTPMLRKAMERRGREPEEVVDRLSLVGRFGTPDEIANAALWLCSDAASFTVGHALAVDGGLLLR